MRQPGLGAERQRLAGDHELAGHAGVGPERVGQRRQPVGAEQLVAAQRADRAARLVQAAGGEVVCALERTDHLGVGVAVAGDEPRALELQRERGQRVGEHVVHVAGDAAALGLGRRLGLGLLGLAQLLDELLGAVAALRRARA